MVSVNRLDQGRSHNKLAPQDHIEHTLTPEPPNEVVYIIGERNTNADALEFLWYR